MSKEWSAMTTDERCEAMFAKMRAPEGVTFVSPQAEKDYAARAERIIDVIQLKKEPDQVPVVPMVGFYPAVYAGKTPYDAMYDYQVIDETFTKYMEVFKPDAHIGVGVAAPGKLYEILDYKLYKWPGHGVPKDRSYQAVEGEYMMADEYDDLIQDPTHYFLTKYFPRIMGTLAPLQALSPMTNILEMYGGFTAATLIPFGVPPVQEALKALMEAGNEALKWAGTFGAFGPKVSAMGFPSFFGGGCKVPFDVIGDTLRGTRGIITDMYRQPAKLIESLEALVPIMIKMGVSACMLNGNPICFIPLHKGADGFMSDAQFKKFYWPTAKKLFEGLIAEGCVPFPWAEGGYNSRLDVIGDVPKGRMMWGFDDTDMKVAKKKLKGIACVTGNVSSRALQISSVEEMKTIVRKLIDDCGEGGGYMMMNGASLDDCKAENLKAMIDTTQEYGKYK